jgi:putative ABC transport system permease protein
VELWVGALNLGILYAFTAVGIFITFRIYDFPDITVDGSFTLGAAASAVFIAMGWNPFLALAVAFIAGAAAGAATGLIHTRLKINGLLAGILVLTGLFSINLHIMGRANVPLLAHSTFVTFLEKTNPGVASEIWTLAVLTPVIFLFSIAVSLFFRTDAGISMRCTGNNPIMGAAAGVDVDRMKVCAVAAANGLTGVSGGLVAQYQGFADIGMGIGTIMIGLAAVIIGESVIRRRSIYARILGVIAGSVIFRLMIALALSAGLNPIDLKILTALFILATLILSKILSGDSRAWAVLRTRTERLPRRPVLAGIGCAVAILAALAAYSAKHNFTWTTGGQAKVCKIGVVQVTHHPALDITRDSLLKELEKMGYQDGRNAKFIVRNANGDMATVNTILDEFLRRNVDLVVTISTSCTQAAINKIKDRPVVFATVADPFIIGAGSSDADHLANVTGVYGLSSMADLLKAAHQVLPGKITIGSLWDPSQVNAIRNLEILKEAVDSYSDITFVGTTVTGSSEVYHGALSLVQKGITAFVLIPDNIIFSAFESVVKAARDKKIPIFISDVERLKDGALLALGYDFTSSGIQGAHLVVRILNGENPKDIPFERYTVRTLGVNTDVARELGVTIPPEILAQADLVYGSANSGSAPSGPVRAAPGRVQAAPPPPGDNGKEGGRK